MYIEFRVNNIYELKYEKHKIIIEYDEVKVKVDNNITHKTHIIPQNYFIIQNRKRVG